MRPAGRAEVGGKGQGRSPEERSPRGGQKRTENGRGPGRVAQLLASAGGVPLQSAQGARRSKSDY